MTGPTGDLGIALVSALERSRGVKRIVGMARRPFDPADAGLEEDRVPPGRRAGPGQRPRRAEGRRRGGPPRLRDPRRRATPRRAINVDGSRNVFEAAVEAGAERICYASSVAAYGFHEDNPDWLTEDVPPRGTPSTSTRSRRRRWSSVLAQALLGRTRTDAWVFRPCIVAGPRAQMLLEEIPYFRLSEAMPDAVRAPARRRCRS